MLFLCYHDQKIVADKSLFERFEKMAIDAELEEIRLEAGKVENEMFLLEQAESGIRDICVL